jgi:UPF0755 protein
VSAGPPPVPGGRTAAEREAARREREARRAGKPLPPPGVDGDGAGPSMRRPLGSAQREAVTRAREILHRRRSGGAPARGRGPGRLIAVGVLAVAAVALVWFLFSLFQPFAGGGHASTQVRVPKGAGVGEIGDLLEQRGVVSSSFFFQARARLGGDAGALKPGTYRLKQDMSYGAVLDALTAGPGNEIVTLTIPEGRSRREVARIVGRSLNGSYVAASRHSHLLRPSRYGAKRARDLEGFLFPATYELKRHRPASVLVNEQLAAFKREFAKVNMRFAKSKNLTAYDVLTIASMIEREVQVGRERRLVASVIYNRLHAQMPLQIDATVRFATGNWTRPLRRSQLLGPNPYNTYVHPGLPPGPIGSPGLASIQAAARPARTSYLYYVVKPCGRGQHVFTRTGAEFQRARQRYNQARARRGGKSPTNC